MGTVREEIYGEKECKCCGTIGDSHHSAECIDTNGKGYKTDKSVSSSVGLEGLANFKKYYRLQKLDDGYYGIYLKDYNVRAATIHQKHGDLIDILENLLAD